jgi:hypothetical protein
MKSRLAIAALAVASSVIFMDRSTVAVAAAAEIDPNYTQFAEGIGGITQVDAEKTLINFLTSPASAALLKARGYE